MNITTLKILVGIAITGLASCSAAKESFAADSLPEEHYATILSAHVNEAGLVNYKGLLDDRKFLDVYVRAIGRLDRNVYEQWEEKRQIAFWINTYNALTLQAIIDHYPVDSIKDIGNVFKSVWDKLTFEVMGKPMTLNDIEHKTLRTDFKEPGIHMAINCASVGCPPLRATPFTGENLDEEIAQQTRQFLSDKGKFRIDATAGTVLLSPIFKWFGEDFVERYAAKNPNPALEETIGAPMAFIAGHLEGERLAFVRAGQYKVDYLDYDWNLNEQY